MNLLSALDFSLICLTCTLRVDTPNMRTLFAARQDGFVRTHVFNNHEIRCSICQLQNFQGGNRIFLDHAINHVTLCRLQVLPLMSRPYVCENCTKTVWLSTD